MSSGEKAARSTPQPRIWVWVIVLVTALVAGSVAARRSAPGEAPPPPRPADTTPGSLDLRIDRAGLASSVRVYIAVYRQLADGTLDRKVLRPARDVADAGVEALHYDGMEPARYVVRAMAQGSRTVTADVDVRPGLGASVSLLLDPRGGELVAVLPRGFAVSRASNVTIHQLGAGVRGDFQSTNATPADREVRFSGLGPGRYLLQFWDERSAIVIDMPDVPRFRVELPPRPAQGARGVRVVVSPMRGGSLAGFLTIAWIPGRVTEFAPGLWMNCKDAPGRFDAAPGPYTVAVIDGIAGRSVGISAGVRLQSVDVVPGATQDVVVPLDR